MPVYNAESTVIQALESLRAQTFKNFEIVVVNDGSNATTIDVLKNYNEILLLDRPHHGIVHALNDGITAASGEYIARMDADDICHPERISRQTAFLDTFPDIGVVGCRVCFGGDRTMQAGYAAYVDWINTMMTPEQIAINRFVESPLAHPSVMFRKELTKQYGAYRNGLFPEDYELWLRWLANGVLIGKVDEELLVWNDPPGRLSRTDERYSVKAFYKTKAEYLLKWLEENNPHHPDVVVWGAGRVTRRRAEILTEVGINITGFIDFKPRKLFCGTQVFGLEKIPKPDSCFVLSMVGNRGAREEIRVFLNNCGFTEGINCIFAA